MNEEHDADVDRRLREAFKRLGEVDGPVVDRLSASVAHLPARSRRHSGIVSTAVGRSAIAAVVVVTAMAVVAVGGSWLSGRNRTASSGGPLPTNVLLTQPAPTPELSPGRYANDPRMLACEKTGGRKLNDVLYAWELAHGRDYRANLVVPVQPRLASAAESVLVVVFKTGDSSSSSGGNPPLIFTPPPGSHTVCVGPTGADAPVIVVNVAEANLILPPASAPIGVTANVAIDPASPLSAMAWDSARNSLWVVTWRTGPTGRLTRLNVDGTSKSWPLPNGPSMQIQPPIQAGLQQPAMPAGWYGWDATDLVIDGQGKVWIAAGYGLTRFDPATGQSQLRAFSEPDMTRVYADGGRWISAIAADGDGVLIARHSEHRLTNINEAMDDTSTLDLPASWTDVRGIAVLGDRIFAGGLAGLGVFDRQGTQLSTSPAAVAYASLRPAGSDRVAILPVSLGAEVATLLDPNGGVSGTITLQMEAISGNLADQRLVAATDWKNRVWYGEWGSDQPVYLVATPLPSP